ncbi:hypothetical protein QR680_009077 [Steinernema hermaphroditum]|uniref:Vacuolar protein sorting-associated protein 13A n=1 Tax=Steinernema hermaphroditum TaxID=289476 RepID=A0AA39IIZ7_9BILA|nr:hypothetical protein QR680_009077 [Steinernema hermaphroditum]
MVFESLVADLLNRFLGDFVDNLDASQLNIGIWGGDVKLDNLEVKETALDELDLPVKLKFGFLSNLVLKIPWKNLYTEPVIADIEGLFLIVVPNKGVVYSEEKANKNAQDVKQKALTRLEEARKNKRKPRDPQQDTFAEKMVTQVIKNLQVKIRSIHVRYEDKYTNRHRPFVAGVSLEGLDFQTTDANWKPTIHKETVKIIHKLITMSNLAVYWNSHSELISDLESKEEIKKQMLASISTKDNRPKGFKYILEPITMEAKLSLNQKPETDDSNYKIPKIDLRVGMEQLALCVGKFQYQDILLFLEAQERFNLASKYLKYRPNLLEYRCHYKEWWKFAYECVLQEVIRRKKHNWSWQRMKKHRKLVRDYRDAWVRNQTEKNLATEDKKLIERAEKELDVFNVNVARQQAEMEIDRRGLMRLEDQPQGWMNWAKSWWGGSKPAEPAEQPKGGSDIVSKFNEVMTPEEKAKLFEAIDYQENTPPTDYPKFFIENIIHLNLNKLAVVVEDALRLQFANLVTHVEQRPSARAIHVKTSIQSLAMEGLGRPMVTMAKPGSTWLCAEFETNPLVGDYDQLVKLAIAPILVKYHAPAVNKAIDVFQPPESVRLNQLTAAAMNRYEEVKSRSVTGLAHAVEYRTKLHLDIHVDPATVVISEGGIFDENKLNLVADLGTLTIKSTSDVRGSCDDITNERLRTLMEKAYDKFEVRLFDIRLVFADTYKDCVDAKSVIDSPLHIIRPTGCVFGIHKSSIDDLRLPKVRLFGDLPDIIVQLSDERLLKLLKVVLSIPTPPPEESLETKLGDFKTPQVKLKDRAKMKAIMEVDEIAEGQEVIKRSPLESSAAGSDTEETGEHELQKPEEKSAINDQQVQLEMNLSLNQVGVIIGTQNAVQVRVMLNRMGCKFQMRTHDFILKMHLGDLTVEQPQFRSLDTRRETLYVIDNVHSQEEFLVKMAFISANPESPLFETDYKMTEQALDVEFKSLNVTLHQEALMSLKQFGEQLSAKVAEVQAKEPERAHEVNATVERQSRMLTRKISQLSVGSRLSDRVRSSSRTRTGSKKEPHPKRINSEKIVDPNAIIKTRLKAKVDSLGLFIGSNKCLDTMMAIESVTCKVVMKVKTIQATAGLKAIRIEDCTARAVHRNLLIVCGQKEMFHMDFVQYNRTPEEKLAMRETDVDMSVKVRFAQLRFVFLNIWVSRLLNWIGPFQAEAASAAARAQAAATEKATESAQRVKQLMEESPPKIHLDVELAAPTIVVPRKSTSYEVVMLDFGQLNVINSFTCDPKQPKAVIDNMVVELKSINCGSGTLSPNTHEIKSKMEILKPMTFTVKLYRNLSFAWYKDIPEIYVDAELPLIDVSMSQHEYSTMMRILSGNLAENVPPAPVPVSATASKPITLQSQKQAKDTKECKVVTASVERKPTSAAQVSPAQPTAEATDARRIAFKFQMNAISASLYSGDSAMLENGITIRDQDAAFASMTLKRLKMSGSITESGYMDVAISLHTFTMDDQRPGATKITRLLDKKSSMNKDSEEPFVSLRFRQDSKANKHLEFTSTSFFLCLCPEFLGALSSFFVVSALPEDEEKPPESAAVVAKQAATPATGGGPIAGNNSPAAGPVGTITMKCKMREVEVILIENANEPETTQAMILSFSWFLNADHKNGKQHMDGKVDSVQIVSSYFAEDKRKLSVYPVLNRLDIQFNGTIDNATQDQEFMLNMDSIRIKVSPSIIRLLSAVSAGFSSNQVKDPSKKSGRAVLNKYPNYWDSKALNTAEFWWFNAQETGVEAMEDFCEGAAQDALDLLRKPNQKCTVKLESFVLTMEAGSADITAPMILLEMGMSAEARNWASALEVDASASMQMSYYNEAFSVWEPVIEPVESAQGMRTHGDDIVDLDATDDEKKTAPPKSTIVIKAEDMINITVTKSFLQLLNKLGDSFEKAARQISPPKSRQLPGNSPYSIYNETGFIVKVLNSDSLKVNVSDEAIDATHGDYVPLEVVDWQDRIGLMVSNTEDSRSADLRLELLGTFREVDVMRAQKRVIRLPKTSSAGKQWSMLVETSVENSRRLVSLSSVIKFVNHMSIPFEVLSVRDDTNLDLCGIVPAGGEPMNVALPLLYTDTGALYLKPANDQYETSNESITWHEFGASKRATLRCDQSQDTSKALFVELVVIEEQVLSERGREKTETIYTVHLYPPLTFQNLLPFELEVTAPATVTLQGGEETSLNTIASHSIHCQIQYEDCPYKAVIDFPEYRSNLGVAMFECEEDATKNMYLGLHWSTEHNKLVCQVYCPFWIVNSTGKPLRYLESASGGVLPRSGSCTPCKKNLHDSKADLAVLHEPNHNPILLPFADKNFLSKKKARVQVEKSQWSDEFPLDVVGNSGRIVCKSNEGFDYELTVDIQLCQSGLTKIVTLSPFYLLYNNSKFDLEVKEFSRDEWVKLPAESCSGLWPQQKEKRKLIMGRYAGTEEESVMFPFTENFESFCKIGNDYLGLQVTCSVGEASSVVHLEPFSPGMVPLLVINHTDMSLEFCQKGAASMYKLEPNETCYYTWTDVLSKRILYWKMGTYEQETVLHKNDLRRFLPDNAHGYCMAMAFLYGRQRVLMLTTDTVMAEMAFEAYEVERIVQSIEVTLAGLSLSVVDNEKSQEIIHMAMSSSDVVWEKQQKYRFKPLELKYMSLFETAYQQWLVGGRPHGFHTVDKYHVDFEKMIMKRKNTVQKIRRGFETGFWMQYRTSPHQTQIHMKMSHLQVDNQLPACVFPVVLAAVPPPKSVIADSAPKPFFEFSFLMRQSEHSNVMQVQYLRVLIQEFAVQVDQGLINALLQLTAASTEAKPYNKELFDKDVGITKAQLSERALTTASTQQKSYYDDLHISPLMIHLSFSQGGSSGKGDSEALPIQSEFVNVILKSVGVSLTELQDVVFKLAYFERKYVFYNRQQLQGEIQSHYTIQALKQLYVLVFGLDILGNPFGLVRDLSTGVEDLFYQPFHGFIQGPEEFAEGVAIGVQSLFGHAVGGAAGAVSRITGTVGKGVAALTFDDEYQRKRQEALNRRPQNFSEGMARGAKGLGQGVVDGVTGVFWKPIEGAREGGAGGFAKGLGKGLIGAVTRPVSGVVDFASSSLDAVKTVASTSEAAKPIRPPRVILSDQIIRPYSPRDAIGSKIFRDTDRGKYADTDHFIAYAPISEKCVFIVTDIRVLLSRKNDVIGVWTTDWTMSYAEIKSPERSPKGIRVLLKNPKKGFLGIGGGSNGKLVEFVDTKVADNIFTKMTSAYEKAC